MGGRDNLLILLLFFNTYPGSLVVLLIGLFLKKHFGGAIANESTHCTVADEETRRRAASDEKKKEAEEHKKNTSLHFNDV